MAHLCTDSSSYWQNCHIPEASVMANLAQQLATKKQMLHAQYPPPLSHSHSVTPSPGFWRVGSQKEEEPPPPSLPPHSVDAFSSEALAGLCSSATDSYFDSDPESVIDFTSSFLQLPEEEEEEQQQRQDVDDEDDDEEDDDDDDEERYSQHQNNLLEDDVPSEWIVVDGLANKMAPLPPPPPPPPSSSDGDLAYFDDVPCESIESSDPPTIAATDHKLYPWQSLDFYSKSGTQSVEPPQFVGAQSHSKVRNGAICNTGDATNGGAVFKSGMKRSAVDDHQPPPSAAGRSLDLLNILFDCAKTVDTQPAVAHIGLSQLRHLFSPLGDPIERLSSYFTSALDKRLRKRQKVASTPSPLAACSPEEYTLVYKALNEACPYFKFAHLTANQAILEAMDGANRVHIIDFGITQGIQWAALLQAFAAQTGGKPPPRIRLTGIASPSLGPQASEETLAATGRRLSEFAEALNLDFEFRPVVGCSMDKVEPWMLNIEEGESVAANFMLELSHLLGEESGEPLIKKTLEKVVAMAPKVVTLAEFDVSLNNGGGGFQKRFLSALQFYLAIFESVEATMARDSPERAKVERWFFGEAMIEEMVSCEGAERRKRLEGREQWRGIMESAGLRPTPLSNYAVSQARLLLWLYCEAFTLLQGEDRSCLSLAWQQRPILTVSAWTLSSSSSSSSTS